MRKGRPPRSLDQRQPVLGRPGDLSSRAQEYAAQDDPRTAKSTTRAKVRGRLFGGDGHCVSIGLEHYFRPRIWHSVAQRLHGLLDFFLLGSRNMHEELHIEVPARLALTLNAFAP